MTEHKCKETVSQGQTGQETRHRTSRLIIVSHSGRLQMSSRCPSHGATRLNVPSTEQDVWKASSKARMTLSRLLGCLCGAISTNINWVLMSWIKPRLCFHASPEQQRERHWLLVLDGLGTTAASCRPGDRQGPRWAPRPYKQHFVSISELSEYSRSHSVHISQAK